MAAGRSVARHTHVNALAVSRLSTLTLIALCAGCATRAAGKPAVSTTPLPTVETVVAHQGVVRPTLQIGGIITPYRQVGIAANLAEPISEVNAQEGQSVRAGQTLARLVTDDLDAQLESAERVAAEDVERYKQSAYQASAVNTQDRSAILAAQAQLRQAQVNLAAAENDLRRYFYLASQGYVPAQTVQQQETTVAVDRQAVTAARAALNGAIANARADGSGAKEGAEQSALAAAREAANAARASVEQLRRQIARATVIAPVGGVVEAVNANPGEYPAGRQLFTIQEIDRVYALLPASTAQAVEIRRGAHATIVASGSTRQDRGTVVAVLDQVQPGTTNFTIKVDVPNADLHLHSGMPLTSTVDESPVRGIVVPVTAFVDDTHRSVYVVVDGIVRTRSVGEVKEDAQNAVVTGLSNGTVVVKDVEQANVGNGDRVRIDRRP
jgi:multidrug efflux pump subunit AcrA (membrane-fusion protein)